MLVLECSFGVESAELLSVSVSAALIHDIPLPSMQVLRAFLDGTAKHLRDARVLAPCLSRNVEIVDAMWEFINHDSRFDVQARHLGATVYAAVLGDTIPECAQRPFRLSSLHQQFHHPCSALLAPRGVYRRMPRGLRSQVHEGGQPRVLRRFDQAGAHMPRSRPLAPWHGYWLY